MMGTVPEEDLSAIAPYDDAQFKEALRRIVGSPVFARIAHDYFPGVPPELLKQKAEGMKTIFDFQVQFIDRVIDTLQKRTTSGVTISGGESRPKEWRYLYVSNHRDIILDPAIFTRAIHTQGYATPQICLGDNLLTDPLVVDLVKMNKGITVKRNLSARELMRWSFALSELIRREVTGTRDSVWIAQREGRAKDGNDETHPGILKMLTLAGEGDFIDKLAALRIVPVAISYEYDPSDLDKARELYYIETRGAYEKAPGEDIRTMYRGIHDFKGGVHIEVGLPITSVLEEARAISSKNEQARFVATAIDRLIHMQYRNWPSNYIAYDLLAGTGEMREHYTETKLGEFQNRIATRLSGLSEGEDKSAVRLHLLKMYAMPVKNQLSRRA